MAVWLAVGAVQLAAPAAASLGAQGTAEGAAASGRPIAQPLSIGAAWHTLGSGQPVRIAGRAVVASGVLQSRTLYVSLQGADGAIWLFSRNAELHIAEGDSVVATGLVQRYRGTTELVASDIAVVGGVSRARPVADTVALAGTRVIAGEGQLLHVRGIVGDHGVSEGGRWVRLRSTQGAPDSVTLWVPSTHTGQIDLDDLRPGDQVALTGIGAVYRDNSSDPPVAQLVPRRAADVVVLGIPRRWYEWAARGLLLALGAGLLVWGGARVATRRQARALLETEARYRQLLELSPDAVVVHAEERVLFANLAAARLLGAADERALAGRPLEEFVDAEGREVLATAVEVARQSRDRVLGRRVRTRFRGPDGALMDVEVATSPCRYGGREAAVIVARDIGPQLRYERDLRELALLDELTGLHNRRGFLTFAEAELRRVHDLGKGAVLVFADLDGLKRINDSFGHAAGDDALRTVAAALREVVGEQGLVARWSGDEFVALVPADVPVADPGDSLPGVSWDDGTPVPLVADALQRRLTRAVARRWPEGAAFPVSASLGAHRLPADGGETLSAALAAADAGLYRRRGRHLTPMP